MSQMLKFLFLIFFFHSRFTFPCSNGASGSFLAINFRARLQLLQSRLMSLQPLREGSVCVKSSLQGVLFFFVRHHIAIISHHKILFSCSYCSLVSSSFMFHILHNVQMVTLCLTIEGKKASKRLFVFDYNFLKDTT